MNTLTKVALGVMGKLRPQPATLAPGTDSDPRSRDGMSPDVLSFARGGVSARAVGRDALLKRRGPTTQFQ